jgi:AcrR family transcriptional regulator
MDDDGLRSRLIAVGVDLVTTRGLAAVSLREIARGAGVSHGAPRRYFPTHLDLLAGIADRGFVLLEKRVTAALPGGAGPSAQIAALARAYVDFAAANRGMFELMFRHELLEGNRIGLRERSLGLFRMLIDLMAQARSADPPAAEALAAAFWANLHGIAQLRAWGSLRVAVGGDDVEPLLRAARAAYLPEPRP